MVQNIDSSLLYMNFANSKWRKVVHKSYLVLCEPGLHKMVHIMNLMLRSYANQDGVFCYMHHYTILIHKKLWMSL